MDPESQATTLNSSETPTVVQAENEKTDEKTAPFEATRSADDSGHEQAVSNLATKSEEEEERGNGDDDEDREYPRGLPLVIVSAGLCLAVLLVALDNTIIATATPRITDQFQSLDSVGWYASAYLLTACSFPLIFGKLYTFFPIKWVFLMAITIFEVGSAVCGAAPSSPALIVGRAIAGLGAAGIFSGGLIIVAYSVPLHQRPLYNALFGSMYGIASVVGPLLGGAFTDHVTWRWCFYINLPIGGFTIFAILIFLKPPKQTLVASSWKEKLNQFDPIGTAVFIPAIVCLLLALQWGGTKYAWSNGRIIALLVLFGVLIIVFIGIQVWKGEYATVPLRIVRQRSVAFAALFAFSLGSSFFVIVYFVPIWFQAIKGVSATKSGIMCIPMVLSMVVFSLIGGGTVTALGYYVPLFYLSAVLASIGVGLLTTFTTTSGHPQWIGYQVIYGAGVGIGFQLPIIATQVVLKTEDVAVGTAIIMFCQSLGGALFASVAQNIFSNRLMTGVVKAAPGVDPSIVLHVGATELADTIPRKFLGGVQEAYNSALTHTWYVSVALSALSIVGAMGMEWKSVKGKQLTAMAA